MNNPSNLSADGSGELQVLHEINVRACTCPEETDRVTKWVISLGRQDSSQRVHKAFTVFRQILDLAVMGERLINSPARRAKQLVGRGSWLRS